MARLHGRGRRFYIVKAHAGAPLFPARLAVIFFLACILPPFSAHARELTFLGRAPMSIPLGVSGPPSSREEAFILGVRALWDAMKERNAQNPVFGPPGKPLEVSGGSGMPGPVAAQWGNLVKAYQGMDNMGRLRAVNGFFNQWSAKSDKFLYNVGDYWAAPHEFIKNRGGDCEDYAIAKFFALIALGWPEENLWVLLVKEKDGRGHAVLAVRLGEEIVFLDNLSRPKDLVMAQKTYLKTYTPLCAVNNKDVLCLNVPE